MAIYEVIFKQVFLGNEGKLNSAHYMADTKQSSLRSGKIVVSLVKSERLPDRMSCKGV